MLPALESKQVEFARASGLTERRVLGYAFRQARTPILTYGGILLAALLGGAAIVETIFRFPGVGYLLVDAVIRRDYPVAQFFSLLLVFVVVFSNLLADLAYGFVDPRIRHA